MLKQRLSNSRTNSTAFRRLLLAMAKTADHPKWTVSKFMIHCQNRFDDMVDSIFGMGNLEKKD